MLDYDIYMEDYFKDAYNEMIDYLSEAGKSKEGVYKESYVFRDKLQKVYITPILKKTSIQDAIIAYVGKFIDDHYKELSTSGPVYSFTYTEKDAKFLYDTFNIDSNKILELYDEMVKEAFFGKISKFFTGWVQNAPYKILITSILIDALQNNYENIVICCEYLWAFCEYAVNYRQFWRIGVKEDVMKYTIEHLGSKFKVTQMKNLKELLYYDAHSSVEYMSDRLKEGADNVYTDFMQRMRNQIKNKFENISKKYYDNIQINATQHNQDSMFDDGNISDQEGHISNIAQNVNNTVNKFISSNINSAMAKAVAEMSQVDKDNVASYLQKIMADKNNKLYKFIEDVITYYFTKNPTDTSLGSGEFVNFALAMYRSIGTSKDELLKEIRTILNIWMFDIINIQEIYHREATIINYTRAIYNYVILMINYYN